VIPAPFDYVRPDSVSDAVAAVDRAGDDGKVLAGGQSLLPILRMRMADPSTVIDIGRIPELRGVRDDDDALVIGAMTSHYAVLHDELIRRYTPLIAQATATVVDPQVRHRGTFGGSLSHADPAGDLPAVALALDAELVVAGPSGRRTVPAAEFFVDYLTTVLEPGEVLAEIRLPKLDAASGVGGEAAPREQSNGWGAHYEKFHRSAQAWAVVGVAAAVRRDNGSVAEARIGLTNMGSTPIRATAVEQALTGTDASAEAFGRAAEQAGEGTSPASDLSAQADYRQHLARVLTRRALVAAARL
jgi:carbon-monoxide dehydrogenase medium subunit